MAGIRGGPTVEFAFKCGTSDGVEAAFTLFSQEGIEDVKASQKAGSLDWRTSAEASKAAETALGNSNLPEAIREAYYEAFEGAASGCADKILREPK